MGPPSLKAPEWFLRNIVDRKLMQELGERIEGFYDSLFEEVVYRGHHLSLIKLSHADLFYDDFINYIVGGCGLKKSVFKYMYERSALRLMHERRKRFFVNMKRKARQWIPRRLSTRELLREFEFLALTA